MAQKIQLRRDTAANWTAVNPTLSAGEIGVDLDSDEFRIGDGVTAWADLPAFSRAAALAVQAAGTPVVAEATALNFVGATVADAGNGVATVTVEAPTGGGLSVVEGAGTGYTDVYATGSGQEFGYVNAATVGDNVYFRAFDTAFAFGKAVAAGGGGTGAIEAKDHGAFAFGYAQGIDQGDAYITATGRGSMASGYAEADRSGPYTDQGAVARIRATASGATARGFARTTALGGYGYNAYITAQGLGAIAMGYAFNADIVATGKGAGAFGASSESNPVNASADNAFQFGPGLNQQTVSVSVGNGVRINGGVPAAPRNGDIWVAADGSLTGFSAGAETALGGGGGGGGGLSVSQQGSGGTESSWQGWNTNGDTGLTFGHANAKPGTTAEIRSQYNSLVGGEVVHTGTAGRAYLQGYKSNLVGGYVKSTATAANAGIRGNNKGTFAHGYVRASGTADSQIYAAQAGAWAGGYARGAGFTGKIQATGQGSVAFGKAYGGTVAAEVRASGKGSGAFGYALNTNIQATADNAFQFGPGANAVANSLKVGGAGIRLHGTAGAPAAPANGDIWVDASGNVVIRSGGVSVTIV